MANHNKLIISLGMFLILFTACKRDKFYTCYCNSKDSAYVHTLGRLPEDQAYSQCKAYTDSTITCNMEIRK